MLNAFCKCFYFWPNNEDQVDTNALSSIDQPEVCLDVSRAGQDVVIVKNGRRLCGTGGALSNVPIIQNKAYFEVKIQANGLWGVGLASRKVDLNKVPLGNDSESWVLRNDACIYSSNVVKFKSPHPIDEGDVIVRYYFLNI